MKLCRYGKNGFEKPGIIDSEGRLRDLSKVVENSSILPVGVAYRRSAAGSVATWA